MKILKGKNTTHTNYMKDENGNKFYTDNEKCNLMEKTWKNVFKITEDEENRCDKENSEHIDRYIDLFSDKNYSLTYS